MATFSYDKDLYPFESKWLNVGGNQVHYIDEGQGQTILFCHPPVTSSFMYRRMILQLSKTFRCIALDFPGFGLSPTPDHYSQSIQSQARIIEGLIHHLQLKSIYLLMQEIGGHAAMTTLIKNPELLKGIILTDTIIFPVSQYPKIRKMLTFVNGPIFNFLNTNFNFLIRAMTRFGIRNHKMSNMERNTYKQIFNTRKKRRTTTTLLYELVREEQLMESIQTAFATIFNRLPALIVYGEKDPLTQLKVPQRIHEMMPASELHLIRNEGHFPHEGEPIKLCLLISDWIAKIKPVSAN
jgi:haloalkane dehalogenase